MTTAAEFLALVDRCEREEPSRELDCEIAKAVGWTYNPKNLPGAPWKDAADRVEWTPPWFSFSLDAAVTLVPEGVEWNLTNLYGIAMSEVGLNFSDGNWQTSRHKGGHLALAICAAALRARLQCRPIK